MSYHTTHINYEETIDIGGLTEFLEVLLVINTTMSLHPPFLLSHPNVTSSIYCLGPL